MEPHIICHCIHKNIIKIFIYIKIMQEQLENAKLDIQSKIDALTQNKTEMESVMALIQASDSTQEEKDFASSQYTRAYEKNEKMLSRYAVALTRLDAQIQRINEPTVIAKIDKIAKWFEDNSVSEMNRVDANSLYQSDDGELDRIIAIVDNMFLNTEQKTKLITGKLILE